MHTLQIFIPDPMFIMDYLTNLGQKIQIHGNTAVRLWIYESLKNPAVVNVFKSYLVLLVNLDGCHYVPNSCKSCDIVM